MLKGKVSQLRIEARPCSGASFMCFLIDSKFDVSKNIHFLLPFYRSQPILADFGAHR